MMNGKLWFGRAMTDDEFERIFRLNHRTFTGEIPQHAPRADGRLIDRFHQENEYLICKDGANVVGMIALRGNRPFSLDEKLPDLDRYLPPGRTLCEIRLLAVESTYRHSRVFAGLARELVKRCHELGYDYGLISATTRQLKLYAHLGFNPFGPRVGKEGAWYQPMALSIEEFQERLPWLDAEARREARREMSISLLPGPVQLDEAVLRAASQPPLSHRSAEAKALMARCRRRLQEIVRVDDVQILLGSGTLANDAIAQQLRQRDGRGLVLANGEFGERLIDHACRADLDFEAHQVEWGEPLDFGALARAHAGHRFAWIWMAHCETSTGVLNNLAQFRQLAQAVGAPPVLDCISTLGNMELDLSGIALASGVSGKGIGALPGLCFVFHRAGALLPTPAAPRYLDLNLYRASDGVAFTHSSNLLAALLQALDSVTPERCAARQLLAQDIRFRLRESGLRVIGPDRSAAPAVVTVALPECIAAGDVATGMLAEGYQIAHESEYLRRRNWIQLAWMGCVSDDDIEDAVSALGRVCFGAQRGSAAYVSDPVRVAGSILDVRLRRQSTRRMG